MRRFTALLFALVITSTSVYAHNGEHHVMGTVAAITDTEVTVKSADGKTQSVTLTNETKYSKGTASITFKDIKIGDNIVIHALKKGNNLTAEEVKVGTMKMKGMSGNMGGMKMNKDSGTTPPQ